MAVVTGGASGIGLAIAQQCGEQGCKVVLSDGNPQLLSQARDNLIALRSGITEAGRSLMLNSRADYILRWKSS